MRSNLRITGGELRGRSLKVVTGIRPTSGRVRESLMNIWSRRLVGSRFLDLFAGSGAVGLEALSRGAVDVVLAEANRKVYSTLAENCARLGAGKALAIEISLPGGINDGRGRIAGDFDLVFADPPYEFQEYADLLDTIAAGILEESGEVAIEHAVGMDPPPAAAGLTLRDCRRYGDSSLSFYRRIPSDQS